MKPPSTADIAQPAPVTDLTDQPPQVTQPDDQFSTEGDSPTLQIEATDPAGGSLSYEADNLPSRLAIDNSTGLIQGTIDPGTTSSTAYAVTVRVTSDASELTTTVNFNWTVSA
jgi:hypothetical protein